MKAFWWFEEGAIAGMGRPGFNGTHWFHLPFDEALLMGWLGQYSSGSADAKSFRAHVREYGAKIYKFYKLDPEAAEKVFCLLEDENGLKGVMQRLSERTQLLERFDVSGDQIHFEFSRKRLHWEVEFLKKNGFKKIASLTEKHHSSDVLREHFDAHHFPITDLEAPKVEQVLELAELIKTARANQEKIVVHCLAGIGRTSTMLIASHLALGESFESLKAKIARQNPTFILTGSQGEFIRSIAERFAR